MFNSLILALSSSIDSFGIGITYGLKSTKISLLGKIILFVISIFIGYFSIFLGNFIQIIFPKFLTNLIGNLILIFMGLYICFESLKNKNNGSNIFNNPISSDLDNSKIIDTKEAIFLGVALSLDSLCIGICGSIIDINLKLFPLFVSILQITFLSFGSFLGLYINKFYKIPQNLCSLLSGLLLIIIGIFKM